MRAHLFPVLVLVPFLLEQLSCISVTSTTVHVRDLRQLDLKKQDTGEVVIGAGADAAKVPLKTGSFWNLFGRKPFELDAVREPSGALWLQCDACVLASWPKIGRQSASLADANGDLVPSVGQTTITPADITLPYQNCFVTGGTKHQFCEVESRTTVTVPWANVVEADRSTAPARRWGAVLVGLGALEMAGGIIVLSPAFGDTSHASGSRASFAIPLVTTGAVALGFGLWHLLAPSRQEHIFPLGQAAVH